MSSNIVDSIRDEDPSYDPIAAALAETGISREQYAAAFDRVVVDGNFGPISPDTWRDEDGREPASVSEALAVLGRVSDAIDDYRGEDFTVEAGEIRRAVFREVVNIYGSLPW